MLMSVYSCKGDRASRGLLGVGKAVEPLGGVVDMRIVCGDRGLLD